MPLRWAVPQQQCRAVPCLEPVDALLELIEERLALVRALRLVMREENMVLLLRKFPQPQHLQSKGKEKK